MTSAQILASVLLFAAPRLLHAQYDTSKPLSPQTILIARIRAVASENARRMPDFTCGLTIERSQRPARSGRFEPIDTLRLEVAYAGGKELYAWPGAKQFEDREITALVGNAGAIGTGDFTSHAQSVLLSDSNVYTYIGEEEQNGHACHRFDYSVTRARSRYYMRIPPIEDNVGYRGSFWVDKISMDLVKLVIDVDDIPPTLPIRGSRKVIELQRQNIGGTEFLLPLASELEIVTSDGAASINRTRFLNCRQFRGESSLSFEDPPPDSAPVAATIATTLPAGLKLHLALQKPLDLKQVAKGDQVFLQTTRDAKAKDGFIVPRDAEFTGRVDLLECVNVTLPMCYLMVHLETFHFANKEGLVKAALEAPLFELPTFNSNDRRSSQLSFPVEIIRKTPDKGVITIRGGKQTLKPGFSTIWRVLPAQ